MTTVEQTPPLFLFRDSESVYFAESVEHATRLRAESSGCEPEEFAGDDFELMQDEEVFEVGSEESWDDPREIQVAPYVWKLTTTVLEWRTNPKIGPTHPGEWLGPA